MFNRHRGMTLTETAVWVGAVILLTAVLVPTLRSHWAMSDILQARDEVRLIGQALERFHRDMRFMPAENNAQILVSSGGNVPLETGEPEIVTWTRGKSALLRDHLIDNRPGYKSADIAENGWSGPYLKELADVDPWGNHYVVNIEHYKSRNAVFVISAGPNGEIQTPYSQHGDHAMTGGDDIAHRLW